MASNKTTTRTLRIKNETAEYFEGKPLNRVVECVHQLIVSGSLTFDGEEVHTKGGGNPYGIKIESLDSLNSVAQFMGGDVATMIDMFADAVDNGVFEYDEEAHRYIGVSDIRLGAFKERCHELNIDPQTALDKLTRSMK